jgi:hypothetical protein
LDAELALIMRDIIAKHVATRIRNTLESIAVFTKYVINENVCLANLTAVYVMEMSPTFVENVVL